MYFSHIIIACIIGIVSIETTIAADNACAISEEKSLGAFAILGLAHLGDLAPECIADDDGDLSEKCEKAGTEGIQMVSKLLNLARSNVPRVLTSFLNLMMS